jgi:hypothetical protein
MTPCACALQCLVLGLVIYFDVSRQLDRYRTVHITSPNLFPATTKEYPNRA